MKILISHFSRKAMQGFMSVLARSVAAVSDVMIMRVPTLSSGR